MGLPTTKARELLLAHAWTELAGEAMARRATAVIRRGVLEVEVEEPSWRAALESLLPELAARLARAYPELGVRRYRLRWPGEAGPPPPHALPAVEPTPATSSPLSRSSSTARPEPPAEPLERRLEALRERYLERVAKRPDRGAGG